jgi:hypothetical protein
MPNCCSPPILDPSWIESILTTKRVELNEPSEGLVILDSWMRCAQGVASVTTMLHRRRAKSDVRWMKMAAASGNVF